LLLRFVSVFVFAFDKKHIRLDNEYLVFGDVDRLKYFLIIGLRAVS
jgi:hypothetical protein